MTGGLLPLAAQEAAVRLRAHHPLFVLAFVACFSSLAAAQTPGPPSNLTATLNADNTLTLQWTPPTTGGAPTGYIVQIGTSPGASDILNQQVGNVTTYRTAIVVPEGVTYYVRVRALNSSGVSSPSNELTVSRVCISPSSPPPSVTWRASADAIQITWQGVIDASGYRVEVGTTQGASDVAVVTTNNLRTFTSVSVPGPGTYFARVRPTRECGNGPPSPDLTVVVAATPPAAPVVINEFGDFVELKNISSSPVDIGQWRIHTSGGFNQTIVRVATIPSGTTLAPGCTYLLARSGTTSVTPDTTLSADIGDGVALVRTDGLIVDAAGRLNSFDASDPNTPYVEGQPLPSRRNSSGVESFARAGDQDTNNNSADFVALANATPQNGSACGVPPPGPTAPEPPGNFSATANGNTVTLSWTAPPASSGGPVTSYRLEAGFSPGAADAAVFEFGATVTALVFNGIPNGTYYVRVRAVNAAGVSGPSTEVALVVCGVGCTPSPQAVTNLTFQVSGSDVLLLWSAPSSGPAPTGYVIEAGTAPGLSNLGRLPTGSNSPFALVQGVPAGTYYVRVRAANGASLGPPSNEVVVVVP
jgi:hypothetical protein